MSKTTLIIRMIRMSDLKEFVLNEEQVDILIITNYLSQEIKQKLSVICNNSETIRAYIITSFVFINIFHSIHCPILFIWSQLILIKINFIYFFKNTNIL